MGCFCKNTVQALADTVQKLARQSQAYPSDAGAPTGTTANAGQPGGNQRGGNQPGYSQPGGNQPSYGQPGAIQPGRGRPGAIQPRYNQPNGGQSGYNQPNGGQPGYNQPNGGQSGYAQPNGGQSGYAQPGITQDPAQQQIAKLARWVQTRQPATPWDPDPAWLNTDLPQTPLEPAAMATLAALTQAQSQIQQSLAIDLLQTDQAKNFRRVVATLNERTQNLPPPPDPAPWQDLASQATALQQVEQAAAKNLFSENSAARTLANAPGGVPLRDWRTLYQQVRDLAPLLAVAKQLGVELADPDAPAKIAQKLRPLRSVALPPLADPFALAQYTTLAQALSQIASVLGVDPAETDPQDLQQMLAERQSNVLQKLRMTNEDPPALPASVANIVTPAVVKALQAVRPQTLQAMNWKVPPATDFPLVTTGLPAIAFIDTLRAMNVDAVQFSPCGRQCDAGAMLKQAS